MATEINDNFLSGFSSVDPSILGTTITRNSPQQIFRFHDSITPSGAALLAAKSTFEKTGISPDQIDYFISCTATPDFNNPGLISAFFGLLGLKGKPGLEIKLLSAGPLYAIDFASRLIQTGEASRILVLCTDLLARFYNGVESFDGLRKETIAAATICGDGAASFLVEQNGQLKIKACSLHSIPGAMPFLVRAPNSSNFPLRLSKEDLEQGNHLPEIEMEKIISTFKNKIVPEFDSFIANHSVNKSEVYTVSHVLHAELVSLLGETVHDVFESSGHVGAAGIPLALESLLKRESPKSGSKIACVAYTGSSYAFTLFEVQ